MAAEPIHVDVDEELPAIVARMRHSRADEIHLVLPARARFGQSRFNFQLLKQYSMRLGKRVAIVSPDPGVQRLAEESGFGSLRLAVNDLPPDQRANRANGARGLAESGAGPDGPPGMPAAAIASWPAARPGFQPAATRPADRLKRPPGGPVSRIRIGAPQRLPARITALQPVRYVLYAGAAVLLLVGVLATVFYVPSARVTLVAQAESLSTPVDVTAEPGKSPIHVRLVTTQKTRSVSGQATGVKVTPGELAAGQFVYNNNCAFDLQVPNGQRLRSASGVLFAQLGDVVVPAHGVAPANIKAVQSGQNGNIDTGQITGIENNQYSCLTGANEAPTSGGTDDQKQTVIQTSDFQSAKADLEQQLRQQMLDEFTRDQQKGEKLVSPPTFLVEQFTTTHNVDETYPNFTATLTLPAEADYYVSSDVDSYFGTQLKTKVPASMQLTSDPVTANYQVSATQGGHLEFNGQATGYVAPKLDTERVSGQLVGKTSSQARAMLTKLPVRRVSIQQTPLPFPLLPFSASRIYIDYVIDPAASAPKPV